MSFAANKEQKTKAKHDKELKAQIEKEREQQMLLEIERTEKERSKKKGTTHHAALSLISKFRRENSKELRHTRRLRMYLHRFIFNFLPFPLRPPRLPMQIRTANW